MGTLCSALLPGPMAAVGLAYKSYKPSAMPGPGRYRFAQGYFSAAVQARAKKLNKKRMVATLHLFSWQGNTGIKTFYLKNTVLNAAPVSGTKPKWVWNDNGKPPYENIQFKCILPPSTYPYMRFLLSLHTNDKKIPINYQYPLSAAIYKILDKADTDYAVFLHEKGYGKGFKLFCFSDLRGKFKADGIRLLLLSPNVYFEISFHLPEASQNFIKGIFLSQQIEIADRGSKASFVVGSVEALPNPFSGKKDNEIISINLAMASACVAGLKNEKGNYDFLSPEDKRFTESLLFNWKEKIKSVFPTVNPEELILSVEVDIKENPPRSRLMTIKAGTPAETKIRGWKNFSLKLTGEKQFVELLWNTGVGLYNSMGCGMVRNA